ncbi:MAG TPA: LysR substrate-binding domain-containing protein, partial [Microbacteriaceae bacterium]|nr:LysR substrate-binding domain-containing protein [Microbacteriaceae bacterium]
STKSTLAETPWILPPEETFFGRSVRQALHDAGITPVVNHSLENHVAAIALAQAGLGVTVVTPTTANLTANAGHLETFPGSPSRIIEFQTLKSSSLRPSLIALQDVISKVVEEVSKG